jgi:hypothetical protein
MSILQSSTEKVDVHTAVVHYSKPTIPVNLGEVPMISLKIVSSVLVCVAVGKDAAAGAYRHRLGLWNDEFTGAASF